MARAASSPDRTNPEDVSIRRAGRGDAQLIHALILDLAASLGTAGKVASCARDIEREGFGAKPAFEALIAERRGAAVGLCLFFDSFSSWSGRRGVYVQDLYVAESARGLGLGRRLLAEAAAIVRARGGNYLRLSANADNAPARAFYECVGLRRSSTERIYQIRERAFEELAGGAKGTAT